ncbi:MAG: DUF481 domain-containing protein [Lentisphaerae bacterium]|nr:DUF481 domain-containing protein [Lentisphaerota bacterium]
MKKAFVVVICICMVHLVAVAQEQEGSFKSALSIGVTLTDGNSETLLANGSLVTEGKNDGFGSIRAGLEANYGESTIASNTETTVENLRAFVNVQKTLSPMTFISVNGEVLYDSVAQIDYRATLGPGLGVYLIKNDKTSLFLEVGPSYVWEEVSDVGDDYLALRLTERYDYTISKTSRLWQSLEYLPRADDFDDYLLNAEFGAEADITASLKLRLVLQNKYDSTPGAGLEENDLTLITGLSMPL